MSIAVGAALVAVVDYHVLLGLMAAVLTGAAGYLATRRDPAEADATGVGPGAPEAVP